jgi:hypothetical protein
MTLFDWMVVTCVICFALLTLEIKTAGRLFERWEKPMETDDTFEDEFERKHTEWLLLCSFYDVSPTDQADPVSEWIFGCVFNGEMSRDELAKRIRRHRIANSTWQSLAVFKPRHDVQL